MMVHIKMTGGNLIQIFNSMSISRKNVFFLAIGTISGGILVLLILAFFGKGSLYPTSNVDVQKKSKVERMIGDSSIEFPKPATTGNFSYIVFLNHDKTWGYNIFLDHTLMIHQATIPGVQGMKGFVSEKDAGTVASLVLKKLQQNVTPPSISQEELKTMKIIN
jgi:hypothetical protein